MKFELNIEFSRHVGACRCSQPRVGLALQQSYEDERLIAAIRYALSSEKGEGEKQ